jgi:hypothetical protein
MKSLGSFVLSTLLTVFCALVGQWSFPLWGQATPESKPEPTDWGTAVNGSQISLSLDPSPGPSTDVPAVKLWVRNVGTSEVSVELGGHCGLLDAQASELRAMAQSTENVSLILTNSKESKHLIYFARWDAFCAGAAGVFHEEIQPGKTVSVPIDLRYYRIWPPTEKDPADKGWQAGETYSLQAEINVPDAQLSPLPRTSKATWWRGLITSNQLEIHFPAQ